MLLGGGLNVIQSGNLPPATSSGPFFFFSSCSASVNSFPPFFSRALPVNKRAAVITSQRGADRRPARQRWGEARRMQTDVSRQTWRRSEERQQADRAVNDFMGPLVASLSSKVLKKAVSIELVLIEGGGAHGMKQVPDCPHFSQVDQSNKQQHDNSCRHSGVLYGLILLVPTFAWLC